MDHKVFPLVSSLVAREPLVTPDTRRFTVTVGQGLKGFAEPAGLRPSTGRWIRCCKDRCTYNEERTKQASDGREAQGIMGNNSEVFFYLENTPIGLVSLLPVRKTLTKVGLSWVTAREITLLGDGH